MPTVAEIAKTAFDAVAGAIPDAIKSVELFEPVKGAFASGDGTHPITLTARGAGRAVIETAKPIGDVFPEYVAGPGEMLAFLEGFTTAPEKNWTLRIDGTDRVILKVQDLLLAGSTFYVVIR